MDEPCYDDDDGDGDGDCDGDGIGIGIGLLKIHIAASKAELHEITVNYINANCKTLCNICYKY